MTPWPCTPADGNSDGAVSREGGARTVAPDPAFVSAFSTV